MKKMIVSLLMAGMMTVVLNNFALAADVSGLEAFRDTRVYTEETFSDVQAGKWFVNGVKTVFEKGIMDGMSLESFAPSETVTWGQAVTIAARLHATYNAAQIPAADGAWYVCYVNYAREAGLLPSTVPTDAAVAAETITRQELAGLFRSVLSQEDLPTVNDMQIPDLDDVLPEFRTAVEDLYRAGIFTGKDEGRFDPEGRTTRAEIATVITRLLCPGQRQSFDSTADQNMIDQWGNYKNGGFAVRSGDVTYYTVSEYVGVGAKVYSIVERTDAGETRVVYETDVSLTALAAAEDGKVWFVEDLTDLRSLDPVTGESVVVYRSPEGVETYLLYGGEVYVLDCYSRAGDIDDWMYRLGQVKNGGLRILVNGMRRGKVSDMDILHGFGGKLYYSYGEESYTSGSNTFYRKSIWSLDPETGKTVRIYKDNLKFGELVCSGATFWCVRDREDGLYEILRGNLLMPDHTEVLAVLPKEATTLYPFMSANGDRLFFQSSGASRVWEIDAAGGVEVLVNLPTPHYERSCVTDQGIVMHAMETLSVLLSQEIVVHLPDGTRENYLQFLNMPYLVDGSSVYSSHGQDIVWGEYTVTNEIVDVEAERAYCTEDGDVVVEVAITNGLSETIRPMYLTLTLTDGEKSVEAVFYWLKNVGPGEKSVVSAVVTAERLGGTFDLAAMEKEISLKYTKQG